MGTIYLIRHGQGSFNQGDYDRLSPLGVRQARLTGEHLAAAADRLTAICHGELERQRRTAREAGEVLKAAGRPVPAPRTMAAFDENDAFALWDACVPILQRQRRIDAAELAAAKSDNQVFQRLLRQVMLLWMSGRHDQEIRLPTWRQFQERVTDAFGQLLREQADDGQVAVFTSGGPIGVIIQYLLGLDNEKTLTLTFQIMNASITRVKFRGGRATLATFNETAHLERPGDRQLLTYL
ncbi:MAG: histidine phosphatase family protein [Deltaproteobacteria bacterium]|nr:histidine phosphatase family protein [Deltaproteobacteria bacterium]